jgi:hypothetical protein
VQPYKRLRFEQYLNDLVQDRFVNAYVKGRGHRRGTTKVVARSDLIEREETLHEIRQFTYWPPCQLKTKLKGVFLEVNYENCQRITQRTYYWVCQEQPPTQITEFQLIFVANQRTLKKRALMSLAENNLMKKWRIFYV